MLSRVCICSLPYPHYYLQYNESLAYKIVNHCTGSFSTRLVESDLWPRTSNSSIKNGDFFIDGKKIIPCFSNTNNQIFLEIKPDTCKWKWKPTYNILKAGFIWEVTKRRETMKIISDTLNEWITKQLEIWIMKRQKNENILKGYSIDWENGICIFSCQWTSI